MQPCKLDLTILPGRVALRRTLQSGALTAAVKLGCAVLPCEHTRRGLFGHQVQHCTPAERQCWAVQHLASLAGRDLEVRIQPQPKT